MSVSGDGAIRFELPAGLVGFPDLKQFELGADSGAEPFLLLRSMEPEQIEFVAIRPEGIVPDYGVELSDEDAAELGLSADGPEALVLVIATIRSWEPQQVTANLVAPIVVNRDRGVGKQVVLANYHKYSTAYPLIDEGAEEVGAPC